MAQVPEQAPAPTLEAVHGQRPPYKNVKATHVLPPTATLLTQKAAEVQVRIALFGKTPGVIIPEQKANPIHKHASRENTATAITMLRPEVPDLPIQAAATAAAVPEKAHRTSLRAGGDRR